MTRHLFAVLAAKNTEPTDPLETVSIAFSITSLACVTLLFILVMTAAGVDLVKKDTRLSLKLVSFGMILLTISVVCVVLAGATGVLSEL